MKFNSAYAPPPRRLPRLGLLLVGAAVVIVGLGISTFAIQNYSRDSHLNTINVEQLTAVVLDAGERVRSFFDNSQMAKGKAYVMSRSAVREINDPLDQQSQSLGKHADTSIGNLIPNHSVLAEAPHVSQEAVQEQDFLDAVMAETSGQTGFQYSSDPLSITELTAIAPESGLAIVAIEPPSSQALSQTNHLLAFEDNAAWRIQLISLGSHTDAETAWARLQQANPDLLDDLSPYIQSARLSIGTFYRVQAGPLTDQATAAALCDSLKSRNQDCLSVAP